MEKEFEPELSLSHGERSQLAALASMPGYHIFHRVARAEVHKFVVSLINADGTNPAEVLERHRLSKAAAMFYTALTQKVNEEVYQYTAAPRANDAPVDVTEGSLDIGELAGQLEHLPNLLEEADY